MSEHSETSGGVESGASANPYLSRPSTSAAASSSASTSTLAKKNGAQCETRLYIGNLDPTVDEYTLIQTFSKYGKISKLDFLFHKSGPQRGQPRGYAFLEYASPQEALEAVMSAHGKTLRGRRISVTFATKSIDDGRDAGGGVGAHRRDRRAANETETIRTTQLSLAKKARQPQGTDAKIAAMEAKLAKMRQANAPAPTLVASTSAALTQQQSGRASLPAKPMFKPSASDSTAGSRRHRQHPQS